MKNAARSPLFILGYPRSGTTLLRALLGAHPQIHLFNEPDLVQGLRTAGFSIHDQLKPDDRAHFIEQWVSGPRRKAGRHFSTLPPELLSHLIEQEGPLSFKEVYEFLLPKPSEVAVWGEKSLRNVFYVRDLHALYPDALFINIIRDPRAALLSYYRKNVLHSSAGQPPHDRKAMAFFAYHTLEWCAWLDAAKEAARMLGKNVVMQLRYEDLVVQPEVEMKSICYALNLEYDPAMLEATHRKKDLVFESSMARSHGKLAEPVDATRVDASKELPDWARYIVEQYAGRDLEELGYTLSRERVDVFNRIMISSALHVYKKRLQARLQKTVARYHGAKDSRSSVRSIEERIKV